MIAVNGVLRVSGRFAIDWVQLNDQNRLFTGDISKLQSYPYYGAPIHSVADGVVANIYDETDEQALAPTRKASRRRISAATCW